MNKLRIIISLVALAFFILIIRRADLAATTRALSRISLPTIIGCLALVQMQVVVSALRWRFTSRRLGQDITPSKAICEYYMASLLNQLLPGGMAGDALRAWRMRSDLASGWVAPVQAVIFERLSGQIALLCLALLGLLLLPMVHGGPLGHYAWHFLLAATAVGGAAVLLRRWFKSRGGTERTIRDALLNVFVRRRAWLFQGLTSSAILFSYVATFFLVAQATGSQLPWAASFTIIPFTLAAMLIPTGFGGWGTREAAAMALWPMLGASSADGLAASISYGLLSLIGAAPGLALLIIDLVAKRPRAA